MLACFGINEEWLMGNYVHSIASETILILFLKIYIINTLNNTFIVNIPS